MCLSISLSLLHFAGRRIPPDRNYSISAHILRVYNHLSTSRADEVVWKCQQKGQDNANLFSCGSPSSVYNNMWSLEGSGHPACVGLQRWRITMILYVRSDLSGSPAGKAECSVVISPSWWPNAVETAQCAWHAYYYYKYIL